MRQHFMAESRFISQRVPRNVQKIHLPPVDNPVENGYNEDARGAAGRRLTPVGFKK